MEYLHTIGTLTVSVVWTCEFHWKILGQITVNGSWVHSAQGFYVFLIFKAKVGKSCFVMYLYMSYSQKVDLQDFFNPLSSYWEFFYSLSLKTLFVRSLQVYHWFTFFRLSFSLFESRFKHKVDRKVLLLNNNQEIIKK